MHQESLHNPVRRAVSPRLGMPLPEEETSSSTKDFFLQAVIAGTGFFFAAGWQWFTSLHPVWGMNSPHSLLKESHVIWELGSLTMFFIIKIGMLFVFALLLERGIHWFFLQRGSFLWRKCCFSDTPSPSPQIVRAMPARLQLFMPVAFLQLLIALIFWGMSLWLPPEPGTVYSAFFVGVMLLPTFIWLIILSMLPQGWGCFAYAVACLWGMFVAELWQQIDPVLLQGFRTAGAFITIPLLYIALPQDFLIKLCLMRYRKKNPHRSANGFPPLRKETVPRYKSSFFSSFPRTRLPYMIVYLAVLLFSFHLLLGFIYNRLDLFTITSLGTSQKIFFIGQASGAFLAAWLLGELRAYPLLSPLIVVLLTGFIMLIGMEVYAMEHGLTMLVLYFVAGAGMAFGLALLGMFFFTGSYIIRTMFWVLVGSSIVVYVTGYGLYCFGLYMGFEAHDLQKSFLFLLGVLFLLTMFSIYLMRCPLEAFLGQRADETEEALIKEKRSQRTVSHAVDVVQQEVASDLPEEALPPLEEEDALPQRLTAREEEIAKLVQRGLKNVEISAQLYITEATLRVHLRRIYRKLGVQGRDTLKTVHLPNDDS